MMRPTDVTEFWFSDRARPFWFTRDAAFDRLVGAELGAGHAAAARGGLDHWMASGTGCLALCILLDQAPRNMFRGTPAAFATDPQARRVARHAVSQGFDVALPAEQKLFLYLPFEHSEELADQDLCVELICQRIGPGEYLDYAVRHREIIARFGRFPHRNAILGRPSTPEEEAFLREPGSAF